MYVNIEGSPKISVYFERYSVYNFWSKNILKRNVEHMFSLRIR